MWRLERVSKDTYWHDTPIGMFDLHHVKQGMERATTLMCLAHFEVCQAIPMLKANNPYSIFVLGDQCLSDLFGLVRLQDGHKKNTCVSKQLICMFKKW